MIVLLSCLAANASLFDPWKSEVVAYRLVNAASIGSGILILAIALPKAIQG